MLAEDVSAGRRRGQTDAPAAGAGSGKAGPVRDRPADTRRARIGAGEQRPVPPVVPVEDEVPVVPVVVPPAVPLVPPVVAPPQAPALLVVPVEPVVGVLPVVPVVGLPRSVMAPVPLVPLAPLVPEEDVPEELAPEVLSMLPVDLQAARLRHIEAARMMLRVVRFILFSSVLVRGLHHASARLRPP
jgi:hypothetical protein